jgi:hypothetical protein
MMHAVWSWLRFLQGLHGHFAWLCVALLVHPVLVVRAGSTWHRARLACTAATLGIVMNFVAGALLYGAYRQTVRPLLFRESPLWGFMFERKEHLALLAVLLGCSGWLSAYKLSGVPDKNVGYTKMLYALAALIALVVALMGTAVASVRSL